MISLSGTTLVFERELTNDAPRLGPAPIGTKQLEYSHLVALAQDRVPNYTLESIDMRSRERRLVTLTFVNNNRHQVLYFDSYTDRLVHQTDLERDHGVMVFLERLHNELLGGRRGAIANGLGAGLLSLMCITGIVLWWPGKRIWRRALTVDWRARWRRINFDLHSSVGFWTLILVAMWAFSGLYFIFPDAIQKALRLFPPPVAAKESTWKPDDKILSVNKYLEEAARQFPKDELAYLYTDLARPGGQISVFLSRDPAVTLTLEEDIVRLDPATASVLWTESSDRWSPVEKVFMGSYAVHFGNFGGTIFKVIWLVLGLTISLLTITGFLMWWNRLLRKKWELYARPRYVVQRTRADRGIFAGRSK